MGDLKWMQVSSWSVWQIIDPHTSWGLIKGDPTQRTLDGATAGWFVFAQLTRHIRPGMSILTTIKPGTNPAKVDPVLDDDMTLVALDEANKKIVIVVGPQWDQHYQKSLVPAEVKKSSLRRLKRAQEADWTKVIGDSVRLVNIDLGSLGVREGADASVWCTYTGDVVVDRSGEEPRDIHFAASSTSYRKWRQTKYQRMQAIPLTGSVLKVMLPKFSVCTYEVPTL